MLLTLDEARVLVVGFPTGDDADGVLQLLLDAAEADITRTAGPVGTITDYLEGGWSRLVTSQPVGTITSIIEDPDGTPLTLAADDYRVTGSVIERLNTGTNPGGPWSYRVNVSYTAADDIARRCEVQANLVKLAVAYRPSLVSMQVGDWAETYQSTNSVSGYVIERQAILSTLTVGLRMVVI
jgi:hypothetical protein